jgi:hypothetical protein
MMVFGSQLHCAQSVAEADAASPRLYLGGWGKAGAGQRYVSGKAAAQLSSTR